MATMGFIQSKEILTQTKEEMNIIDETFTHSIAFGETGSGKTSSFIYPNLDKRINLGHGILLYDYKGKEHLSIKGFAYRAKRLEDVVEIGKPWGESINFIEKMDEDELDRFFDLILKHGDDNKYWQNSAKSMGQLLLEILGAIENCAVSLEALDGVKRKSFDVESLSDEFSYPVKRTFNNLLSVCNTFERLKKFVSCLDKLSREIGSQVAISVSGIMDENHKISEVNRTKLFKAIQKSEDFRELIKVRKDILSGFGEDSNENLTQNIIGTLIAPLMSLAKNANFNKNEFDIVDALEEGKIIVINAEALSNATLESLNNSILYELSKRTRNTKIHPVSIFIDEAQRVMSANSDLPIDVFREAKVDVFLATQNSALLKEKLKQEKFDALMGNLTKKFYYRSSNDEELESELSLKELKVFEYICNSDEYFEVHRATPLFLNSEKLLQIEWRYQKYHKVLENYLYELRGDKAVVTFGARLYKQKQLLVRDLITKEEKVYDSFSYESTQHLEYIASKMKLEELKKRQKSFLGE